MNGLINEDRIRDLKNNQPLDFGDALYLMKIGKKVRRKAWVCGYLAMVEANRNVPGSYPHLCKTVDNRDGIESVIDFYKPTEEDLFQDDWLFAE